MIMTQGKKKKTLLVWAFPREVSPACCKPGKACVLCSQSSRKGHSVRALLGGTEVWQTSCQAHSWRFSL